MTSNETSRWLRIMTAGAMGFLLLVSSAAMAEDEDKDAASEEEEYEFTVEDGKKVDQGTYDGYIVYTRVCQSCHGPDGLGSSFAPSLMEISEKRSFAEIAGTVANGQEIQPGRVMPSFADDEYVMGNLENIYRYLRARKVGGLERGRPQLLEDEESEEDTSEDQ